MSSGEYQRKLLDMQFQMRENNAYLDDYLKDLNSWTDDIKKKEENLKQTDSSVPVSGDLPPVRNFVEPPKPKRKSKKKATTEPVAATTAPKIRAYDYRSWDKFDVDAECERIDNEAGVQQQTNTEAAQSSASSTSEDEEWQEEVLKKKAEYYKDCGNFQFKQKSYGEAIEFYTKAIECDPTSPVYFANRAQCQLLEQRYGACDADCTLAIQLDKNYLKAYYRRALARVAMQKIEQAREDLEYVLSREPSNKDARAKLDEVNKNDEIKRLGRVYPLLDKPVEKRSTKPLKRIEIQEIDTSIMSVSETTTTTKKKSIVIEELETTEPSVTSEPLPTPPPANPPPQKAPPKPMTIPTSIPHTGFEFKRDWSNLNSQPEQQAAYFERIPPTSYKTIFSTGLDSSVFSRILLLWSKRTSVDEPLINSMYELRQTPRFSTQLSFLGNDDKQLLRSILDKLRTESSPSPDKIQAILREYQTD